MSCMWGGVTTDIRDKKQKVCRKWKVWLPVTVAPPFGLLLFSEMTTRRCQTSASVGTSRTRLSWFMYGVWFESTKATKMSKFRFFFFRQEKAERAWNVSDRYGYGKKKKMVALQGFKPKIAVSLFGVIKRNLYGDLVSNTGQLSHRQDCKFCPAN